MLVKTVTTVVATNSIGQPVDAIPVRQAVAGETDIVGRPVDVITVEESEFGVPVRYVTGKAAQNSAGQWVDTIAVQGGGVPWDGTYFSASNGVNLGWLGFEEWAPWSNPNLWTSKQTAAAWSKIADQTTFDHIRVAIDPTALLTADGNTPLTTLYLGMVKGAIEDVLTHGLKCIVDMHVPANLAYPEQDLTAGYASGNALKGRVQRVWARVLNLLNGYDADQVAFELWNETPKSLKANYDAMLPDLVKYLRSTCGGKITLLLCPWQGEYQTSPDFTPEKFGENTGFVYHMYWPGVFTHQGLNGTAYWSYVNSLPFPVTEDLSSTFIADATARINADSRLSSAEKTDRINHITTDLTWYFGETSPGSGEFNFGYVGDWDGSKTVTNANYQFAAIFGSRNPGSPGGGSVEKWRHDHGLPGSRIFITEFGVRNNYDLPGAKLEDRAEWFRTVSDYMDVQGLSRTIWDGGDGYFSIREDNGGGPVGSITTETNFEWDILNAIGALNPAYVKPWSPADLGSKLIYMGSDASAIAALSASGSRGGVYVRATPSGTGNRSLIKSTGQALQFRISSNCLMVMRQGSQMWAQSQGAGGTVANDITQVMGVRWTLVGDSQFVLGRRLTIGSESFDGGSKTAMEAGKTMIKGSVTTGGETFNGTFDTDFIITDGTETNAEIDLIIAYLAAT